MPSLWRSASIIALVTIISKVLGLVRDQMIAHGYGASMVSDAYLYAFQIPSFALVLLGGVGGPFHTATVSVLSKLLTGNAKPTPQAQAVLNTFLTVTGLVFVVLSVLCFCFAAPIINLIASQASPELKALATVHLQWMSPIILMGGIIGILYGVANVYHRFFWASLSPSGLNITLILWFLVWGADAQGYALALSTVLGGALQVLMQLPDFFGTGFRFTPSVAVSDPHFKQMMELLFPATIGTCIGQLNIYVAMFFVSQLEPGGWTAFMLGNRLIQLPIGVLSIAMLVPLFPRFSRMVAEQNWPELRVSFREGILSLWLMSFPVMLLIALLGQSAVALLFQRGQFDAADTLLVTSVLTVLGLSILPYMLRDGLTRIFYAFNDSRTPLIAGLFSIVLNAGLNAVLVKPYGIAGIAFSTVAVTVANAVILSVLVRKHIPNLELRYFVGPSLKMGFATLMAGVAGWMSLKGLYQLPYFSALLPFWQHLITLLVVTVWVFGVYGALLLLLKEPLASKVAQKLLRR